MLHPDRRLPVHLGLAVAIALTLTACTPGSNKMTAVQTSEEETRGGRRLDEITVEKATTKPTRPSEDGEGIPGYLVDPAMLVVTKESDGYLIVAPPGSISGDDNPANVKIQTFALPMLNSQNVIKISENEFHILDGMHLDDVSPSADGSFDESVDDIGSGKVVLRLNRPANDKTIPVYGNSSIVTTAVIDFNSPTPTFSPFSLELMEELHPELFE